MQRYAGSFIAPSRVSVVQFIMGEVFVIWIIIIVFDGTPPGNPPALACRRPLIFKKEVKELANWPSKNGVS